MTEKRYYTHKHLMKEDKVHDKICHRFMNITETVEHMNMYYQKYTDLKKENEELKKALLFFYDVANCECSTNWKGDMEKGCKRFFNCTYEEAKEKYGYYDGMWWEIND